MKRQAIILICAGVVLCLIGGCGGQNGKPSNSSLAPNVRWDGTAPAQDAIPDFFEGRPAGGAFPESMVGVWEVVVNERGDKWGIMFEPDGSIKKITHSLAGQIDMEKSAAEGKGQDVGSYYFFHMGPCEARYIPETRMVRVKIIVDYYIMKMPAGELEGRMEDYFEGPVSGDGKIWDVKWWSFGWLKDAALPDINEVKANPTPLVFIKLDPNQPGTEKAEQ